LEPHLARQLAHLHNETRCERAAGVFFFLLIGFVTLGFS
jgi:hypothetical protein